MKKIDIVFISMAFLLSACSYSPKQEANIRHDDSMTPMQAVLIDQPNLLKSDGNLFIRQQFNRAESPTEAQVMIEQDQRDDSVAAVRTVYQLKRDRSVWKIVNKEQSYRCARNTALTQFQYNLCT